MGLRRNRQSHRWRGYDYAHEGAYFVTICTHNRMHLFGRVTNGVMQLSTRGQIAWDVWHSIPVHFTHVVLDAFVVMPNHVHGIVIIVESARPSAGATHESPTTTQPQNAGEARLAPTHQPNAKGAPSGSLGAIVGQYKSTVTRRIRQLPNATDETIWQRNYHDRVIRNQREYDYMAWYIQTNAQRWETDTFFGA